jgi:carboxymethylenebutenolidase
MNLATGNSRDVVHGRIPWKRLAVMGLMACAAAGCASLTGDPGVPYLFVPSGKGPFPGVIVLHAKNGLEPHFVTYAQELSEQGFVTVAVDYHARGGVDNIDKGYDLLAKNTSVMPGRIGVLGFSKGAFEAVRISNYYPEFTDRRLRAVVAYYVAPAVPSTSERHAPILFLHGTDDVHTSAEEVMRFCASQQRMGTHCEAEIYAGARHAFDQPGSEYNGYNPETTKAAFRKTTLFLHRYLKGDGGR